LGRIYTFFIKKNSHFSTLTEAKEPFPVKNELNPWFITGFTDGEGCFSIFVKPVKDSRTK
jgi:hypothetical protein